MKSFTAIALIGLAVPLIARADLPEGWGLGGNKHEGYEAMLDPHENFQGKPALVIHATDKAPVDGEANVGQSFNASAHRGKRMRFTAYLKTWGVTKWTGLVMSVRKPVDAKGGNEWLRVNNMMNRPVKGNTDWTKYSIVLDVPDEASTIYFGFHLIGAGSVWMSQPSVDAVPVTVPVTNANTAAPFFMRSEPQLDFSAK